MADNKKGGPTAKPGAAKPAEPSPIDGEALRRGMAELAENVRCSKFEALGDPNCGPLPPKPPGRKAPLLP